VTNEDAQTALQHAQELHSAGRIDEALAEARRALDSDPDYVAALSYLGTTLVTRKLDYARGLEALERALALAPDDPGVHYSLGWLYEFVAYRLEKQAQKPYRDPLQLYQLAADRLRACIALDPEQGLREDAEDLLESIVARLE
jgi:tetratricopeptide (TPR) repeat protein